MLYWTMGINSGYLSSPDIYSTVDLIKLVTIAQIAVCVLQLTVAIFATVISSREG